MTIESDLTEHWRTFTGWHIQSIPLRTCSSTPIIDLRARDQTLSRAQLICKVEPFVTSAVGEPRKWRRWCKNRTKLPFCWDHTTAETCRFSCLRYPSFKNNSQHLRFDAGWASRIATFNRVGCFTDQVRIAQATQSLQYTILTENVQFCVVTVASSSFSVSD